MTSGTGEGAGAINRPGQGAINRLEQGAINRPGQGAINRLEQGAINRPLLNIVGLKKSFGLKPVLRGIDLSLARGERLALMGANGAGKTTLLRILAALTQPTAGRVTIEAGEAEPAAGRVTIEAGEAEPSPLLDVVRDAQEVRRLVGFVGHQPYLYDELTALENLLFFGKMYGVKDARTRAPLLLQRVGLGRRARERVGTFSRGMVQRLSLARALLHRPPLLLLDEPDTGLDSEGVQLVTIILDEHRAAGGTTLLTTHQLERANALCDRIVTLDNGRIVRREAIIRESITDEHVSHANHSHPVEGYSLRTP